MDYYENKKRKEEAIIIRYYDKYGQYDGYTKIEK